MPPFYLCVNKGITQLIWNCVSFMQITSISYEMFCTRTHFETKGKGSSDMVFRGNTPSIVQVETLKFFFKKLSSVWKRNLKWRPFQSKVMTHCLSTNSTKLQKLSQRTSFWEFWNIGILISALYKLSFYNLASGKYFSVWKCISSLLTGLTSTSTGSSEWLSSVSSSSILSLHIFLSLCWSMRKKKQSIQDPGKKLTLELTHHLNNLITH